MKVFVILGPTSSGKTSLALEICSQLGLSVVSADSRQVYKEMDVGTGKKPLGNNYKVTKGNKFWEINNVSIWGYDLVYPNEYFSSYNYAEFALPKLRELLEKDGKTFLVGGTGFYVDMVTGRIKPSKVLPDFEFRRGLEKMSLEKLQKYLEKISPSDYQKIDIKNPTRLIRAIEKATAKKERKKSLNYLENTEFVFLGLTAEREYLYQRADLWLEKIWCEGLIEETSYLIKKYPDSKKLNGLVYKTVVSYLKKELSEEDAKQRIKYDLHAYIRRQQTYFKKMPSVSWLDINQDNFKQKVYNIVSG